MPQNLRKDTRSGSKGSYFGSQSATDKESEAKRNEAQKKAKETDKISAGAGNRRREIEGKLSPQMRNKAAAAQQAKADEIMMLEFRRSRAAVARRFARPVEKVLSIYSSHCTDLYDVLNVDRDVKEGALKKAYRKQALLVHPGEQFSTKKRNLLVMSEKSALFAFYHFNHYHAV